MGWLTFIVVTPAFLGVCMVLCGFSITNDVNSYFGKVLEEQGQDIGNYIIPPTLFIVVGFLLILLSFLLMIVVVLENPWYFFRLERSTNGLEKLWSLYFVLYGCTLVIQIAALALLLITGDSEGQMPRNTMTTSMGEYYHDGATSENFHVQFWDNLQTNAKCCGVYGYSDWASASQAPEIGFIPESCCIGEYNGVENCTGAITKEKMNDWMFVENFIYPFGCRSINTENEENIKLLKLMSGFGIFSQVLLIIIYLNFYFYGNNGRGWSTG